MKKQQKEKKMKDNFDPDRIEASDTSFFERVRAGYLYLAEQNERIHTINGMKPIEEIHKEILRDISTIENKEIR